jgi:DNA-binding transcriptional regulator LsrR (DeoR family)
MSKFVTVSHIAEKWGVTERYVQILCKQGRVDGAVKFGNSWAIPDNAEKPKKLKSGFKGRRSE